MKETHMNTTNSKDGTTFQAKTPSTMTVSSILSIIRAPTSKKMLAVQKKEQLNFWSLEIRAWMIDLITYRTIISHCPNHVWAYPKSLSNNQGPIFAICSDPSSRSLGLSSRALREVLMSKEILDREKRSTRLCSSETSSNYNPNQRGLTSG